MTLQMPEGLMRSVDRRLGRKGWMRGEQQQAVEERGIETELLKYFEGNVEENGVAVLVCVSPSVSQLHHTGPHIHLLNCGNTQTVKY